MLGEVLKSRIHELLDTSIKKSDNNAFWIVLRDIAREEIINLSPKKIDSDTIVPVYYNILSNNLDCIPEYFKEKLSSNDQERFRVINRNIFTSNAFNPDGLANQPGIIAYKEYNDRKKGKRIIYKGVVNNVNKE